MSQKDKEGRKMRDGKVESAQNQVQRLHPSLDEGRIWDLSFKKPGLHLFRNPVSLRFLRLAMFRVGGDFVSGLSSEGHLVT